MSRETIANVIARVNKLRELSKGNTNEHEAAAAARAAASLIDKFQLSEMDLELKGEKDAEPVEEIAEPLYETGRAMLWVDHLATALCEHNGCTYYWKHVYNPMKVAQKNPNASRDSYKAAVMVGRKSDSEIVRYMFTWLQPVIVDLMKTNAYGRGMRYSQNYALGVVKGIKYQLDLEHQEIKNEAAKTNQSQAMVLLDNRTTLAESHLKKTVKLHKRQIALRNDAEAKMQGFQDGKSIQLKKGIGSGSNSKLLK